MDNCEPSVLLEPLLREGIQRPRELAELLQAVTASYTQQFPGVTAMILFGGITLGEFQPPFSDVDLAVVFEDEAQVPKSGPTERAGLPIPVQKAIAVLPLASCTCVSAKHVSRAALAGLRSEDWQEWAARTAGEVLRESSYPFTLCDTWLLHKHGLTLYGNNLTEEFPFLDARPTCPAVEMAQLKWLAGRFRMTGPFGSLRGLELLGEIIYYATNLTRRIFTLQTARVIGRVQSTRWYGDTWPGLIGERIRLLGQRRCLPEPIDLPWLAEPLSSGYSRELCRDPVLWPLFLHYARDVVAYAVPGLGTAAFSADAEAILTWIMSIDLGQKN